jgi:hypothetical protein
MENTARRQAAHKGPLDVGWGAHFLGRAKHIARDDFLWQPRTRGATHLPVLLRVPAENLVPFVRWFRVHAGCGAAHKNEMTVMGGSDRQPDSDRFAVG